MRDANGPARLVLHIEEGGQAVHGSRPMRTAIGALVYVVTPEARVKGLRVLRIHLEVGGAERRLSLEDQVPGRRAVRGLPDAELGVQRGRGAARAAPTAQDRGVQVVGVVRIHDQARDRYALEVVARDVRPGLAAIGALEDAVAEVAVPGESP